MTVQYAFISGLKLVTNLGGSVGCRCPHSSKTLRNVPKIPDDRIGSSRNTSSFTNNTYSHVPVDITLVPVDITLSLNH